MNNNGDISIIERANLHKLFQEHAMKGASHLLNLYDEKDTSETSKAIEENTNDLVNFIAELSGKDPDPFHKVWERHLKDYENYTRAIKADDIQYADEARENLEEEAEELGRVVHFMIPDVSEQDVADAMQDHMDLTMETVDAHAEEDNAQKAALMVKSSSQAVKLAEVLTP